MSQVQVRLLKKAGGAKKYYKYSECEEGQVLVEGTYIGRSPNKFGKENFDFKSITNEVVCLNHSGQLSYLVENFLVEGQYCRVTYLGTETLEKGPFKGKAVHRFDLEVADDEAVQLELPLEEVKPTPTKETKKLKPTTTTTKIDLSDLD